MRYKFKWFIFLVEFSVLFGVGYKVFNLQESSSDLLLKTGLITKNLYQKLLPVIPKSEADKLIEEVNPHLVKLLGTYKTSCQTEEKYGYKPFLISVEGLDPLQKMQAVYGEITEPCLTSNISYKKGEIGQAAEIEKSVDNFECWFYVVGILIALFKGIDLFIDQKNDSLDFNKRSKKSKK